VFLSRSTHNEIVALYEARLKDAEARLADVTAERDFYRNAWLERLGLKFPIPKPAEVMAINPGAPVTVPDEATRRKTFVLDRFDWTEDDRQWYEDYHVRPMLEEGTPREELDCRYHDKYGNRKPVEVFLDSAFPQ